MAYRQEPIAIVGAGCRFPGESNRPSKLWELLKEPRDVASKIPIDRFNSTAFYHPEGSHHGTTNVKESYFIKDNIRHFDAQFFSTPATEADAMDPQHRQLLEVVYEGLEDAGLTLDGLQGSNTAVFVGLMSNDYSAISSRDFDYIPTYGAPGVAASNASSRVSYFFDWHGASMTIDTACSSSLVALHQAVQVLRDGSSSVAIAAGTNLLLDPLPYVSESNLSMLSPTGRSRMWDASADGYARGDGVAAVILKTLSQALRDGDQIDCVIRETGCNQDGRTKGITMPSGVAQAALIRDTYARAGLDPTKPEERCQYFEAHGTGTPAGDPQESSALDAAFFNAGKSDHADDDILYVGSVKTVIGHTEGTAGLAGLLKAYQAVRHGVIPPNRLFEQLSPAVAPFYKHLRIVSKAQPWPTLPVGVPRRASVNSFGFGGSNAHAILESYSPTPAPRLQRQLTSPTADTHSLTPFIFSANSQPALASLVRSYASHLERNPTLDLNSLRYTLATRRSTLPFKTAFSASSHQTILTKLTSALAAYDADDSGTPTTFASRSSPNAVPSILGVFTGQGAQWATMGVELIRSHPRATQVIAELDASLASLPNEADRPGWKIGEMLAAEGKDSRIGEAAISQPLCTAVQIVLADLVRAAGMRFKAVVGHSSGEIGAAYVAGFVSARDAIRLAYYRGLHAAMAGGEFLGEGGGSGERKKGAMLAAGTTLADSEELCGLEDFEGRLCVAASNAPNSVTLSGDADAVEEARAALEAEGKFARVLRVDTAYHSHHMQPCAGPYEASLRACDIQVLTPEEGAPVWVSSVREQTRIAVEENREELKARYWLDNMTGTVLFSQAVQHALQTQGPFNQVLELGPHPALKGPASDTLRELGAREVPYAGTLTRGKHDVESLSDALGSVWTNLGRGAVNFASLREQYPPVDNPPVSLLKGLPLYPWDHNRVYWNESRMGKLFRTQIDEPHELLGKRLPEGTTEEVRWKNILKPTEMKWLAGHALQGQTVFPGTGYIALANEAAMQLAADRDVEVQAIELVDFQIGKAIAIDEATGAEIVVSLTNIVHDADEGVLRAHYACYSTTSRETGKMAINAQAQVVVTLGEPTADVLQPREAAVADMADVDIGEFYGAMGALGYGYDGPFKGLSSLRRRLGHASGTINRPPVVSYGGAKPLLFHPGMLDTALQSLFAAFSAPGDARLWALHAPTSIRRVTLVPSLCGAALPEQVQFDSMITAVRPNHITGDVDLLAADGVHKCIEIDGLGFIPFSAATEADDRHLFCMPTWGLEKPNGEVVLGDLRCPPDEKRKGEDTERVAFYYLRSLNAAIPQAERDAIGLPPHHEGLFDFAQHLEDQVRSGALSYTSPDWFDDTDADIERIMAPYGKGDADFDIMRAVGQALPAVIRGETTILEHMTRDGMLDNYYRNALGFSVGNKVTSDLVAMIANRYPHMDILEIGAGTGGATYGILEALQTAFTSYTYTDISAGFFEKARDKFAKYANRMVFKTLDIERDPLTQGYSQGGYDMVIAANVLHATAPLERTLQHARSLLKPGGYLVLLEIVNINQMPVGLIMGGLPGWWVGREDGRRYSPTITLPQWNRLLKKTGFGGIDTFTPMKDPRPWIASAFAAQAVDADFELLRRPLAAHVPGQLPLIEDLVVLGGEGMETSTLVDDLERILRPRAQKFRVAPTLDDLDEIFADEDGLSASTTVLSLADIDGPVLRDMTEPRWERLKQLLGSARSLLWVTSGYRRQEAYAGAMVGLQRSITYEQPQLRSQLLEIDQVRDPAATVTLLAELLLRLHIADHWQRSLEAPKNMLWSTEPELLHEDGLLKVLRVLPDKEANDRYNAAKRRITKQVAVDNTRAALEWDGEHAYLLRELKPVATVTPTTTATDSPRTTTIQVEASQLTAVRVLSGALFPSVGTATTTGTTHLSLFGTNTSQLTIPRTHTTPIQLPQTITTGQYLSLATAYIQSHALLARTASRFASVLVHDPPRLLADVLSSVLSAQKGSAVKVHFSSSDATVATQRGWAYLTSRMPRRAVRARVLGLGRGGVDCFVDLSSASSSSGTSGEQQQTLGARIGEVLPGRQCEVVDVSGVVAREAVGVENGEDVAALLRDVVAFVEGFNGEIGEEEGTSLPVREVVANQEKATAAVGLNLDTVVDWRKDAVLDVVVEPVDRRRDIFQAGKTYWMVGLAGDLGQSLCDWMVDHGARNIVLTSRNPKVSQEWVDKHASNGVHVEYTAGDVTDMKSLRSVYESITSRLPPIAGVANGALVLRDKLFLNTDYASLEAVLKPKVQGTLNLDRLFGSTKLDWFVAFSSIVATIGNTGQSAYSAANCFIKALVEQRRARGLPGSTIDISRVLGVGYVERESKAASGKINEKIASKIQRVSMPMSEADLHQLFAEGIAASPVDSGRHSDIVSGIRILRADETDQAFWAANIKFSHFIRAAGREVAGAGDKDGRSARVAVKSQLVAAKNLDDVVRIVKAAFSAKLNFTLQNPDGHKMPDSTALVDLGIDSLVAVEVRTWFMQELGVDMPVLKVLGGATIADLVDDAVGKLPEEFLAKLGGGGEASDAKESDSASSTGDSSELQSATPDAKSSSHSSASSDVGEKIPATPFTPWEGGEEKQLADVKDEQVELSRGPVLARSTFVPEIVRTEPQSYTQSRFWFLKQYLDDPTTSNITFFFRIKGKLDPVRMAKALRLVCTRHESLRTCFFAKDETAFQGVMQTPAAELQHTVVADEDEARNWYEVLQRHIYDIEQGDTIRLVLCDQSVDCSYLVVGYHHIAMDGFSWELLMGELQRAYLDEALLLPVKLQYPVWAARQRREVEAGKLASERKFWRKEFATLPPTLPLLSMAKASARQPLRSYGLNRASARLESGVTASIKSASRTHKVSPFHFHLAVFRCLLVRLSGVPDICIGMADANRVDAADAGVIGCMLNLLPLRFNSGNPSQVFTDALREARTKAYAALAHSRVPFNTILDDVGVPRTASHNPLFQAFIEYRPAGKMRFAGFDGDMPRDSTAYSKTAYDVALNVFEDHTGEMTVSVGTQTALYSQQATELLLRSYVGLLESFAKRPEQRVEEPPVWPKQDIERAISLGTGELTTSPWPATLIHRIDDMTAAYPDSTAVKDTLGNAATYRQLAQRVSELTAALTSAGATPGSTIAVYQAPGVDYVASMLAVLRLGATHVPLEHRQGLARLAEIVALCHPAAILVDASTASDAATAFTSSSAPLIDVSALPTTTITTPLHTTSTTTTTPIPTPVSTPTPIHATPSTPAILLFTSGTTGTPKGISLTHANLRAAVAGLFARYPALCRETVLQQTALSFDMALDETFVALCGGGTLIMVERALRGDSAGVVEVMQREGVSYTRATPAEYASWVKFGVYQDEKEKKVDLGKWKWAFAGGDRMTEALRGQFARMKWEGVAPGVRLFNSYGPTEITMSAVKMEVALSTGEKSGNGEDGGSLSEDEESLRIPLGTPMPNYALYVVDERMNLLPPGVAGEILVGGAGVSRGYLGDAALTADKFLDNPWAPAEFVQNGWTKMYRTGDRGRLTEAGAVVFHGRILGDTQIKLRGLRIELGDIEHTLLKESQGALSDVVCSLRKGGDGDGLLVAHTVLSVARADRDAYLSQLLAKTSLPAYMRPATIIAVDRLPLTVHQKIDRAAVAALPIPKPATAPEGSASTPELTDMERLLLTQWQAVLPEEMSTASLGPSADFFSSGGTSLLLVELQARIRSTLNLSIPLLDLLEAGTLANMADKIQAAAAASPIDWDAETAPPPLSSIPDLSSITAQETNDNDDAGLEIILTGATGHLGRHLLRLLLASPLVRRVHCLAVRDPSKLASFTNTTTTDSTTDNTSPTTNEANKLVIYPGDLTTSLLGGLTPSQFTQLASRAHAIVHCAASRSFWDPYRALRGVNVRPTRELVALARGRGVPVHFMSSGAVGDVERGVESWAGGQGKGKGPDEAQGYVVSKWASERVLRRAVEEEEGDAVGSAGNGQIGERGGKGQGRGLGVYIYRTVGVDHGKEDENDGGEEVALPDGVLDDFAAATLASNTILDTSGPWSGSFDLVSVHAVARQLCGAVLESATLARGGDNNNSSSKKGVTATHLPAEVRLGQAAQLAALLQREDIRARIGGMAVVSPPQWLGAMKRAGFGWMVAAQDAAVGGALRSRR